MQDTKILIIHNDTDTAEQIRQHLISISCPPEQVTVYRSVAEAMVQPDASYTLVFMSLFLFYSEGSDGIKQLQQYCRSCYSIIVVAGQGEEEKAVQAVALGAGDYIISGEINAPVLQKTIRCALARNGINYKQIFEESPAPMYMYDKETFRFLAVNKACCRQYGFTEDEFLQMTAEQIRPAEDISAFHNARETAPNGYHDYGRWKHLRKNGDVFVVNAYAHDTNFGNKEARLVTAIDVSLALITEQQLQDKNKEVSNILESIADGFFALNPDSEFTYINRECERIFGFRRGDTIGKNIDNVFDKKEYHLFHTQYRQAESRRLPVRFENEISSISKWLSVTIYPTKSGMAVYLVDVTERRLIREKLYNDGQQLRAIINNTPDIIWLLNSEEKITVHNDAFRQWMHHLVEDANAQTLPSSIATNWREHFDLAFSGQPVTFTAMETKGADLFYREVSLYPVRSAAGDVVNISCFARDVTRQQLRIQKIQLQNEYLEKIAWMHSHEARGPVANILGLASLFNMSDPDDPDNKMMMDLIVESAHQLDKVIRRIVADIDAYQLNYGDDEE